MRAFLLVAGAVFWPGLYRYSELKESTTGLGSTVTVLRTNRLTGKVETLDRQSGQWVGSTPAPRHATPQSLPAGEQAQVAGLRVFGCRTRIFRARSTTAAGGQSRESLSGSAPFRRQGSKSPRSRVRLKRLRVTRSQEARGLASSSLTCA